jgi:hypothetical protein
MDRDRFFIAGVVALGAMSVALTVTLVFMK